MTARSTTAAERVELLEGPLLRGDTLATPPAPSRRAGDALSGEWDPYYGFDDGTRRFIRRNLTGPAGLAPDQLAAAAGLELEAWWTQLEGMVSALRDSGPAELWDSSVPELGDLMGPAEVADWLGVRVNTVAQWRARSARGALPVPFPRPVARLSGRDIFDARAVEAWAIDTDRLELEPEPEKF